MDQRTCSAPGCGRSHLARGLCSSCYQRYKLKGLEMPWSRYVQPKVCIEALCDKKPTSKGLCPKHYAIWRRSVNACIAEGCDKGAPGSGQWCSMHASRLAKFGSLELPTCSVVGCTQARSTQGLCRTHFRESGLPRRIPTVCSCGAPLPPYGGKGKPRVLCDDCRYCEVDGCSTDKRYKGQLYCPAHLSRFNRWGDPLGGGPPRPRNNPSFVNAHKYRVLNHSVTGRGQVLEHRYLMEQELGRRLYKWELVHHKNGDTLNNSSSNLELCLHRQPPGQRVDDLVEWVVDYYREAVEAKLAERSQLRLVL